MKYLGIDYGTKKVGLAVSDALGTVAFPREVLPNDPYLNDTLAKLVYNEGIEAVVVGESKNFAGADNAVAELARSFAKELTVCAGVPVHFEDERLTTKQARALPQQGSARGDVARKRASVAASAIVDAHAAAIILQTFLDKQRLAG